MSEIKAGILKRLRAARKAPVPIADEAVFAAKTWTPEDRYARLRRLMESVNTEFIECARDDWPEALDGFPVFAGSETS